MIHVFIPRLNVYVHIYVCRHSVHHLTWRRKSIGFRMIGLYPFPFIIVHNLIRHLRILISQGLFRTCSSHTVLSLMTYHTNRRKKKKQKKNRQRKKKDLETEELTSSWDRSADDVFSTGIKSICDSRNVPKSHQLSLKRRSRSLHCSGPKAQGLGRRDGESATADSAGRSQSLPSAVVRRPSQQRGKRETKPKPSLLLSDAMPTDCVFGTTLLRQQSKLRCQDSRVYED